jgi:hypothetical protein
MKNKKIISSWNKVKPDEAAQERMLNTILTGSGRRRKRSQWKPVVTVAAACVVLLAGTYFYNNSNVNLGDNILTPDEKLDQENQNPSSVTDTPSLENAVELTDEIKGLPVNNFRLSEMELLVAMDRIAFFNFLDLFKYGTDSFVIVKVAGTQQEGPSSSETRDKQISAVKVLETLWGDTVPETINLTQYLYGGCTGEEATNLLRKDGVYLLPLSEYGGGYYIYGDLDVLFEIDDTGRIWSHSDYSDFNRFDGEDYHAVTVELQRIIQDETLMLAASEFGMAFSGRQLLEVTILSDRSEEKNEYGYAEVVYTAHVEKTLSGGEPGTEITVRSYADEKLSLNRGERYLFFVDNYDEKHYINANMMAGVTAEGTIQDLGGDRSPFADYNGYTVEKLQELADKMMEYQTMEQQ